MTNFSENVHTMKGREYAAHIPVQPLWLAIIRVAQGVLALITLALSAYALSVLGSWSGYGMNIFTSIWTFGLLAYIIVTPMKFPAAYNCWAQLALEIGAVIFWLTTWALLASEASLFDSALGYYGYGLTKNGNSALGCTKGAAALGAFTWVFFVVSLVFFGISLHRMRTADGLSAAPPAQAVGMEQMGQAPVGQTYQAPVGQTYQPPAGQTYQATPEQQHFQQQNMA